MRIHVWSPSVRASRGGIESYSASLVRALAAVVGKSNLAVLVRNDSPAELGAQGWDDYSISTSAWLPKSLWSVGFALLVVMRALQERPGLIIATHLNFGPFASFVRKWTGIRYWIVLHGYESWEIQRPSQQRAVREADLLLPVSTFTRDRVRQNYGVPRERMHVLHDTFDPARFSIGPKPTRLLERFKLSSNDRIILTVRPKLHCSANESKAR